ncbi:MAG: Hpt domain-containing protein [Bacteroidetes bacterium]|nr:Hpt domain-containing protein [Bacteroidota bacterium]
MADNYSNKTVSNLFYLNELAKGDPDFVKEMIDIFLVDNKEEIQVLEKSIQNQDYLSIKEIAHKMKSTVAFVGIDKLIENELGEIERLTLDKSEIQKIEGLFVKVKDICQKAAEELKPKLEILEE